MGAVLKTDAFLSMQDMWALNRFRVVRKKDLEDKPDLFLLSDRETAKLCDVAVGYLRASWLVERFFYTRTSVKRWCYPNLKEKTRREWFYTFSKLRFCQAI